MLRVLLNIRSSGRSFRHLVEVSISLWVSGTTFAAGVVISAVAVFVCVYHLLLSVSWLRL